MAIKYRITILILLIMPLLSCAQETEELLSLYFNEIRSGKYPAVPKQLSIGENANKTLAGLSQYMNDSSANVRAKAYGLLGLAGPNARKPSLREEAVRKLLEGAKDLNSGNAGIALEYLTYFSVDDFSISAKDSVRNLLRQGKSHADKVIKLIGFLDIKDLAETIRPLSAQSNPRQLRWAALLALTRLQDAAARQELMNRVRKLPVNDDVIYEIFPDLIYTRDREAINYMVELIHSDGKFCISPDAERETPIPCGYRIMEQLAPVIKDYPLQIDESGDLKTTDYLAALASVRYWFTKNKDYGILTDKY